MFFKNYLRRIFCLITVFCICFNYSYATKTPVLELREFPKTELNNFSKYNSLSSDYKSAKIPLAPVIWKAFRWLLSLGAGELLMEGLSRLDIINGSRHAINQSHKLHEVDEFSDRHVQWLREIEEYFRKAIDILESAKVIGTEVREGIRNLNRKYRNLSYKIDHLLERTREIEARQDEQLIMIVDNRGRIIKNTGRIDDNDRRITELEKIVFPDPYRFLKYDMYISGNILYFNTVKSQNQKAFGGQFSIQFNFTDRVGLFFTYLYMPLSVDGSLSAPENTNTYWANSNWILGGVFSITPPQSSVSLQISLGGGLTQSELVYLPIEESIWAPEEDYSIDQKTNLSALVKLELGIAPPRFRFEPFLSGGFIYLLNGITTEKDPVANIGTDKLWYVSLGVRYRFDLN